MQAMVTLKTLETVARLQEEMARAGRTDEESALQAVVQALRRAERGFMTTGQAAERLGISIPTVKRWIERGTLAGGEFGGRWLVTAESVERVIRIREVLDALDREGNPTDEEIQELYRRKRVPSRVTE